MEENAVIKGKELFVQCDKEGKGFLLRSDLESIRCELQLSPSELDDAFYHLDTDGDGRLTMEEFISGFAGNLDVDDISNATIQIEDYEEEDGDDDEQFDILLENLGARHVFKDEETIRALWNHLRQEEGDIVVSKFEDFLAKMTVEMKQSQIETDNLQTMLKTRMSSYEERVKRLYEEMEAQIKLEKEKGKREEELRERKFREQLRAKVEEKDQLVQEMVRKQSEMETKLRTINESDTESKHSQQSLIKEKETLERQLMLSHSAISELQKSLEVIKRENLEEKRYRAKAAIKVSESIALEREELVKQLDLLRMINKQLRDEHDERTSPLPPVPQTQQEERSEHALNTKRRNSKKLKKRGSVMSDYIQTKIPATDRWPHSRNDVSNENKPPSFTINGFTATETSIEKISQGTDTWVSSDNVSEKHEQDPSDEQQGTVEQICEEDMEVWNDDVTRSQSNSLVIGGGVLKPVIKKALDPQRLFKVVFIGDSGVGKSTFINRICNGVFKSTFSATIGVDFHTHRVECNGQTVVLQLWDTAGQERFRSITNQYMRKADGIVIMYDVASETSFKNVRNWLSCVQDFTEAHTQILIVGNKMDLCTSNSNRAVQSSDGLRVAEENACLFFETSVKLNRNVKEAINALANNLQETEDLELEMALQLHTKQKNKKLCCL